MNANTSIYAHISSADNTAKAALLTGLGNWALGQLAWNAQRYVRDLAATHEVDPSLGQDAIQMAEDAIADDDRDPPVGLERVETVSEKMKRFGALYYVCCDAALAIGADEYNRPQEIRSRIDWIAEQTGKAFERARDLKSRGDLTHALRVANQANEEAKFWKANKQAVIDEMHFHASNINPEAYDIDEELVVSAVEKMNAVAAMYKAVLTRCNSRKSSRFFEANGPLGDQLRSEVGALEAELGGLRMLDTAIQKAHSQELYEAISRGVNVRLLDDIEKAETVKLNTKLERELARLGV